MRSKKLGQAPLYAVASDNKRVRLKTVWLPTKKNNKKSDTIDVKRALTAREMISPVREFRNKKNKQTKQKNERRKSRQPIDSGECRKRRMARNHENNNARLEPTHFFSCLMKVAEKSRRARLRDREESPAAAADDDDELFLVSRFSAGLFLSASRRAPERIRSARAHALAPARTGVLALSNARY